MLEDDNHELHEFSLILASSFSHGSKLEVKSFYWRCCVQGGDFSRSRASLEMTDNYRSGGRVKVFRLFCHDFCNKWQKSRQNPTFLQNQQLSVCLHYFS